MKSTKNKKMNKDIQLGTVDLLKKADFEPKNMKTRITAFIDVDVYDALKARAMKGEGDGKYQAVMNKLLRSTLNLDEESSVLSEDMRQQIILFVENVVLPKYDLDIVPSGRSMRASATVGEARLLNSNMKQSVAAGKVMKGTRKRA